MIKMRNIIIIIICLEFVFFLSSCNKKICKEHNLYEIVERESTCKEEGLVTIKCHNCEFFTEKVVKKKEHSIVIDEMLLPTCEKTGLTEGSHCAVCDEIIIKQEIVPFISHEYVSATCERPQYCINCNKEIGIKLDHQYKNGLCIYCDEEEISEIFDFSLSDDESYYIIKKLKNQTLSKVTLPEKYKNIPVKKVAKHAIKDAYGVNEITIPDTIEIIEEEAFVNLGLLKTLFISSKKLEVGYCAFEEIPNLENVYFQGTMEDWLNIDFVDKTSNPMFYAKNFYLNYETVTEVDVPETIEKLGYQLYNFKHLQKLILPKSIKYIEKGALKGCVNIEYLELPFLGQTKDSENNQTLQYIFNIDTYKDKYNLNKIFGEFVLKEVVLTDVINLSDGAFRYFNSIEKVVFSDDLKIIPAKTFYNSRVKEVVLPKNLEVIGNYAFYNCINISIDELPDSLIEIGDNAFETVNVENLELPQRIQKIGDYAFSGGNFKEIVIPNSLTNIGNYAFSANSYLKKVDINSNLEVISEGVFAYCQELKEIKIPSSVTTIKKNAFRSNFNLESLYLPSSIEVIEEYAFDSSPGLILYLEHPEIPNTFDELWNYNSLVYKSLYDDSKLPSNIKYYLNVNNDNFVRDENLEYIIIDDYAVCTNLINSEISHIIVPNKITKNDVEYSVLKIGDFCFYNDKSYYNLRNVTLPSNINEIGDYAFYNSGIEKFVFPLYLDRLGKYCFANCTQLIEVSVQKWGFKGKITTLEEGTFYNAFVMETFSIPNTITTFEEYSMLMPIDMISNFKLPNNLTCSNNSGLEYFINYQSLNEYNNGLYLATTSNPYHTLIGIVDRELDELILHKNTKIIAKNAIYGCKNLQKIELPNGLLCIDTESFMYLDSLKEIVIPETVKYISDMAFCRCTSLEKITVDENNSNYKSIDGNLYSKDEKTFIQYAIGKNDTSFIIPSTVINISSGAFYYSKNLISIEIPNKVVSINDYAFAVCENLSNIEIPNTVTTIGNYSFQSCQGLTSITIPKSVLSIGNWAFVECSNLTTVVLSNGIKSIGDFTFYGCTNLTNIEIPSSLISIGASAFYECLKINNVYYNGTIEDWCNIQFYTHPDYIMEGFLSNPMYYGANFFMKNTLNEFEKVTEIIISDTITTISDYQFCGFEFITSINLPNNLTRIGSFAFYNCSSLTSVILPKELMSVENYAFEKCKYLKTIYNLSELELTIGSTDNGYVAYYAKYIHTELPREILLEKEVAYDVAVDSLDLPETVTFSYNEEEITLDVIWDTTTFVESQVGEQIIYGVFNDDELYDKYNIKREGIYIVIKVLSNL